MLIMVEFPRNTKQLLRDIKLSMEDINMYIFHQASKITLYSFKEKLNFPENKFSIVLKI
tara:strand:+ start:578 stop:754 length:177 start_codon:yes stop_codon:yes gene_type:complete